MNIRTIEDTDYERLESAGGYLRQYGANIRRWIEKGYITPDDCYLFEAAGKSSRAAMDESSGEVAGGVCFSDDTAEAREILDFALADVKTPGAAQILKKAAYMAAKPGTKTIGYNLYNDTGQYHDILELFRQAGFEIAQEKLSYSYERAHPPARADGLVFRSVAEVGEECFIDAVRDVTVGTLDKLMADDAHRLGGDKAAREYVESLKEIDFNPDWWRLGYRSLSDHGPSDPGDHVPSSPSGPGDHVPSGTSPRHRSHGLSDHDPNDQQLVGLIIPQELGEAIGGINYVGVLPQHRGHGYGAMLLTEGTCILHDNGMRKIIADIDAANHPLAAALEQVGYTFSMEESVLLYKLAPPGHCRFNLLFSI